MSADGDLQHGNGIFVYANGVRAAGRNGRAASVMREGENGRSIRVARSGLQINPKELRPGKIQPDEFHLYVSKLHEEYFIDCIYSARPTIPPAEALHCTITIAHLANIAIRLRRNSLCWDRVSERVNDDATATAMLTRLMRKASAK